MPETILVPADKLVRIPPRPGGPRRREARHGERRERPAPTGFGFLEFLPMSIFSRTRDIVAANFSDLLDKAEDPAKMIRMIILEMEETLVEVRSSAARTMADQKEMHRQIARLDKLQESWTEKAELALSKDREDLAKQALVEKQKAADMADSLRSEIEVLDDALRASEADIAKLQGKLREARTRQNAIATRLETAENAAAALARELDRVETELEHTTSRFHMAMLTEALREFDNDEIEIQHEGLLDHTVVIRNGSSLTPTTRR